MGTTVSQLPSAPSQYLTGSGPVQSIENGVRHGPYTEAATNGEWAAHQQEPLDDNDGNHYHGRASLPQQYNAQQSNSHDVNMIYDADEQMAAEAAHRQEQQGVSDLSHVASAIATNGGANQIPLAQISPGGGPSAAQSGLGLNNAGAVVTPGNQLGMEKRGPVEFNHAIGYVNKIKVRERRYSVDECADCHDSPRIDSRHSLTSTNLFLRSYRLISENRSRSKTSMHR